MNMLILCKFWQPELFNATFNYAMNTFGSQIKNFSIKRNHKLKKQLMGNLLYTLAVILIILWAIGYLGYNMGGLIHILLVIAVIAVILRVIQGRKIL
ncbi:MAG: lmo0937 family membrane protein [Lutibacter sp.]